MLFMYPKILAPIEKRSTYTQTHGYMCKHIHKSRNTNTNTIGIPPRITHTLTFRRIRMTGIRRLEMRRTEKEWIKYPEKSLLGKY